MMKSGFSTIMLNVVYRGLIEKKCQFSNREQDFIHPKNIMLRIWWEIDAIVHYELLDNNETITVMLYCDQLCHLKAALIRKQPSLLNRKGVIFHHDNAHPHTAQMTKDLLGVFG